MKRYNEITIINTLKVEKIEEYIAKGKFIIKNYPKDYLIHLEGDRCNYLEIIIKGEVQVERISEDGRIMTVSEFSKNGIIGGNLIFSPNPFYPMTVTAVREVSLLAIEKEFLFKLLKENSEFLKSYLQNISDNTKTLGMQIKNYTNKSLREKIITFLELESERQESKTIKLKKTKKALAQDFGVERTSLSRELQKMKNDGLINYNSKEIIIK